VLLISYYQVKNHHCSNSQRSSEGIFNNAQVDEDDDEDDGHYEDEDTTNAQPKFNVLPPQRSLHLAALRLE